MAQDEALSRLKPGFEFPWGHHKSPLRKRRFLFALLIPSRYARLNRDSNSRGALPLIRSFTIPIV